MAKFDKNLENNTDVVVGGKNKLNEQHNNESNITKANAGTSSSITNANSVVAAINDMHDEDLVGKAELRKANNYRHSNESGTL